MKIGSKRILWIGCASVSVAAAAISLQYSALRFEYDWYRFQSAETPEKALALSRHGDTLERILIDRLKSPRPEDPASAAKAVKALVPIWATDAGRTNSFIGRLCSTRESFSPAGRDALRDLLPDLLSLTLDGSGDPWKSGDTELRLQLIAAIRRLSPPHFDLAVHRLADPEAEIRRAALLIVGPGSESGADPVETETLVRFLHDPDAEVRAIVESCLKTRGLGDADIGMARKLTHRDPRERLELLLDLRRDRDRNDLDRWLERLSRDDSAAVRLGTARVAAERRVGGFLDRLIQMSASDPDGTVRQQADYYLQFLRDNR